MAAAVTNDSGGYSARLHGTGTYRAVFGGGKLPGAQASYGNFSRTQSKTVRAR